MFRRDKNKDKMHWIEHFFHRFFAKDNFFCAIPKKSLLLTIEGRRFRLEIEP